MVESYEERERRQWRWAERTALIYCICVVTALVLFLTLCSKL